MTHSTVEVFKEFPPQAYTSGTIVFMTYATMWVV